MSFGNSNFDKRSPGRSIDEAFEERFGTDGEDRPTFKRSKYAAKKAKRLAEKASGQIGEHASTSWSLHVQERRYGKDGRVQRRSLHIGIVKWYDRKRGSGYIVTNKFGYDDLPPASPELVEPSFNADGCSSLYQNPREGDLVVYTRNGSSAVEVKEFTVNDENISLALAYELLFPVISGKAYNSPKTYNENVLHRTLSSVWRKGTDVRTLRQKIGEAIKTVAGDNPDVIIEKILNDPGVLEDITRLYMPNEKYEFLDESVDAKILGKLIDSIVAKKSFDALVKIPAWCGVTMTQDMAMGFLNESKTEDEAEKVLRVFDSDSIKSIYDPCDASIPWLRRLTLRNVTQDGRWIRFIDLSRWDEIRAWLCVANSATRSSFLWDFSEEADADRLDKVWADAIDSERVVALLVRRIVDDENGREKRGPLVAKVACQCATEANVKEWCNLFAAGVDLSVSYGAMADCLNRLAADGINRIEEFCREVDAACGQDRSGAFLKELPQLGLEVRCALFAITGNAECLSSITDLGMVRAWLANRTAPDLLRFIKSYAASELTSFDEKEDVVFSEFDTVKFADAIKLVPEEEQYQLLQCFPRPYVLSVAVLQLGRGKVKTQIVEEEWERIWSELPYAVFDLETDGENVREFALIADRGNESYVGETQLKTLLRSLRRQEIIVGHNVKNWDLPVLEKKGYAGTAFVWDTLEIEILLNPCRYTYSLHTTHVAKDDVDLTDRLFKNQMWRLANDDGLCDRLREYLPPRIKEVLAELKQPYFASLFQRFEDRFFNELKDVDPGIVRALEKVSEGASSGQTLLIAPRELWGCVAKYVNVQFPEVEGGIEYFPVSAHKIRQAGIANGYPQTVLECFAESSPTPIVANLPHYLRVQYFPDEQLRLVVKQNNSSVKCVDVAALEGAVGRGHYDRIFILGCEFGNRIDQHVLDEELVASDFLEKKVSIPLRLASAGYTAFVRNGKVDEYRAMSLDELPQDARSVWAERLLNGKYRVCYNFDCDAKITSFLKEQADATIERTPWTFEDSDDGIRKIFLARSIESKNNNEIRESRVGFASNLRANYWCYQLKLLKAVAEKESDKPIVYILENDLELDAVRELAKEYGFSVPQMGGLVKCVEAIQQRHNSLLIISREDFRSVVNLRIDVPFCFVWDGMAVDKCRMMWRGQMPFGDEKRELGDEARLKKVDPTVDTPRSTMMAAWPMYEYYYRFIEANCSASTMCIMDPYFDDYNDLGDQWHVEIFAPRLWESMESYETELVVARKYLKSTGKLNGWLAEVSYGKPEVAMDIIRDVFIPGHDWHTYQREILPRILSRKTNCLISIPTGGGKSILFQGPALYNSMLTNRLSIVITPLKALMEDQVLGLQRKGFHSNVDYINGDRSSQEIQQIYRKVAGGEIALLYVAPERFRSRAFVNALMTRIANDGGWEYLIFDEAHCVSQWGQEFRPEYLHVIQTCSELQKKFPDSCLALYSATVTKQIEDDIRGFVGNLERMGQSEEDYNPIRNHIGMSFIAVEHDDESRVKAIAQYVNDHHVDAQHIDKDHRPSLMIVFCRTRKQCEETSAALRALLPNMGERAIDYFHAGMDADERDDVYQRFLQNEIVILCATKAFGMGMDVPNVHYIVHYSPPSVLEDYLQEVGRAGRDRAMYEAVGFGPDNRIPAVCLFSNEDFKKAKEMIKKGNLSWLDVIDINNKIQEYIQKIQTLDQTKDVPVVIPRQQISSATRAVRSMPTVPFL